MKIIDKKVIKYINSKTSNGYSLSQIIKEELGGNIDKKELENKRKYVSKKISINGYKFNKEKKIYELTVNINEKDNEIFSKENEQTTTLLKSKNEQTNEVNKINIEQTNDTFSTENNEVKIDENDDTKPKRKYTKKSEKEYLEKTKDNPLYYECSLSGVFTNIDFIYSQIQSNPKKIGIRLHHNIVELFKEVENRYGYLDFYLLVNNAIYSCHGRADEFKKSSWLMDYSNFISENQNKEKKQVNLSSCSMIYDTITLFQNKFPILDRSEIVNFSLYVYAQCYLKSYSNKE